MTQVRNINQLGLIYLAYINYNIITLHEKKKTNENITFSFSGLNTRATSTESGE